MSNFSNGEWKCTPHGYLIAGKKLIGEIYEVSRMYISDDQHAEADANARLIAAAPQMYKLLKNFARCKNDVGIWSLKLYAEKLLARIDGEDAHNVPKA